MRVGSTGNVDLRQARPYLGGWPKWAMTQGPTPQVDLCQHIRIAAWFSEWHPTETPIWKLIYTTLSLHRYLSLSPPLGYSTKSDKEHLCLESAHLPAALETVIQSEISFYLSAVPSTLII